ncbi:hypothetical protein E2N91_19425 [Pseudomonas syringae pv. tomato]|nr:hypothetical protein E2N91_19425 [Pseudomonas syringae pv. tomato]TES80684.1 hypothetical protein E2N89_00225 [Pseudomonas syringae pv. tomato]
MHKPYGAIVIEGRENISCPCGSAHILTSAENGLLPGGRRSGLVHEGLRSGPETGHIGCVWHTEAADFTAGSRQFADKSAPTKTERSWASEASPDPLPRSTRRVADYSSPVSTTAGSPIV